MTQVYLLGKKVKCASYGYIYKGTYYISYYTKSLTPKERKRLQSGKLNFVPCPKCGTENEVRADLPDWHESAEDILKDIKKEKKDSNA